MTYKLKCNSNEYIFEVSKKVKNQNKVLLDYIMYRYSNDDNFKFDIDNTNYISIEKV